MDTEKIQIICESENIRIDAYLSEALNDLSRNYIQKLISGGHVTLNGKKLESKKIKVTLEDLIEIDIPEPELLSIKAESIPIDIVYEDDDLMIINKPQGMVVHPAPGNYTGTLVNALMALTEKLSSINGVIRPGIVHRIDKDTSGLLMVAKNNKAHEFLAAQLKDKTSRREYYAIVNGVIKQDSGTIDKPLGRSLKDRKKIAIIPEGREAVTHYEVLERFKYHTLVKLKLETGRTHQIRVHMASIGYPLLGDPVYGVKSERVKYEGQALHAKIIGFVHPTTHEQMLFESELPDYFIKLIHKCKSL
ncbi:RluA family pseudouridine synthase [Fusibacter sp. 3D3]|uniref:RluA family pseudouridine synthase n=1 Tax=Fusibacter sp. 3D3 TaxID=1048380 RepID=UPI000852E353|nr:RluA family pseudouridine synthase [Fusibacter sp. 3D3]GAU78730.1 ribosomal large subunit pseudouridine synthase D [Fusibacter sp. 3D3]